jgi:DNA (cytosine-5)-methyltransferase 1
MTHASLFSGIGGFDLAAEWAGWENIFHCEWNPFGQKVLAHHFPNSKSYNDITKTDFSIHSGEIDVLTGGFPCQPYSAAGKRLGKADERHLFPHMLRCIKEVKPRWVIGENVRGLVNWNEGMVFNEVYDDLEREGYEVQSFLIPAAGVNAPHQRYRIWFVAYCNNEKRFREDNNNREWSSKKQEPYDRNELRNNIGSISKSEDVTNTNNQRCEWNRKQPITEREISFSSRYGRWDKFPIESPLCRRNDGIPKELDGITFPKWRQESIKAYGNAIVPQVAFEIFKAINEFESL